MIVALTGFMACGKSTFGRAAAENLGCRFIDLDDEIARLYDTPAELFAQGGETLFRQKESEVLAKVLTVKENAILALGGGTVLRRANCDLLHRAKAKVVWLDTSFEIISLELSNADRPLVREKSMDEIKSLYDFRRPKYSAASDAVVKVTSTDYSRAISALTEVISKLF